MTYRPHHRRLIAVVAVVALALAGCTVTNLTPQPTPTTSPWPYQTFRPTAKPDPALTATSLAESLVILEGLPAFKTVAQSTPGLKPVWDYGYLGITADHLSLSIELWGIEACKVGGDVRYLYGFVDPAGTYLAQFAAWSRQGQCVDMGYSTRTVAPQGGTQRKYTMHVTLFDRGGIARQWFYDQPVTFQFIEAGSGQCPGCQYHHWVLTS